MVIKTLEQRLEQRRKRRAATRLINRSKSITYLGSNYKTYFMLCEYLNRVKIGKSHNPEQRLPDVKRRENLKDLRLLGYINGDEEKEIQDLLRKHRIFEEWYTYNEEVKAYIDSKLNLS